MRVHAGRWRVGILAAWLTLCLPLASAPAAGEATGDAAGEAAEAAAKAPAPRLRVAVLGFRNLREDKDSDWIGAVASATLTTKLAEVKSLLVVERDWIDKVVKEQKFSVTALADPATAGKTGKLLAAGAVVLGDFASAGGKIRFNVRVVDVESGEILHAATVQGGDAEVMDLPLRLAEAVAVGIGKPRAGESKNPEALPDKHVGGKINIDDLLPEPATGAKGPAVVTDEDRARMARKSTENRQAFEAYGRGLAAVAQERWDDAGKEFARAGELDPAFAEAWLQFGTVIARQPGGEAAAEKALAAAQTLFSARGQTAYAAQALRQEGALARRLKKGDLAEKCLEEALALHRGLGDDAGACLALDQLAQVHEEAGQPQEALRCYEETLALYRKLGSDAAASQTQMRMAALQKDKLRGRFEEEPAQPAQAEPPRPPGEEAMPAEESVPRRPGEE
jgi:TolB-like protein